VGINPLNKVVEMLQSMVGKAKEDMKQEKILFAKAMQWCDDTKKSVERNVVEEKDAIESLTAAIEKAAADIQTLNTEIQDFQVEVDKIQGEMDSATAGRQKENVDFKKTQTDYRESISALSRAIEVLRAQPKNVAQAKAELLQAPALMHVSEVHSFLQQPANPEAHGYENQSGGVIGLLRKLEIKFRTEEEDLQRAEMKSKSAYEMVMQDLTSRKNSANESKDDREQILGETRSQKGVDEGELSTTQSSLTTDSAYLSETSASCDMKAGEMEIRTKTRSDELGALAKAIEILQGDEVMGASDKHLPKLVQTSFIQAQRTSSIVEKMQHATQFLQDNAARIDSPVLSLVAMRVAENPLSREGVSKPFAKIVDMIKNMIMKLKDEAGAEGQKHAWCQTELKKNKQRRDSLTDQKEKLEASVEELTSRVANLADELTSLAEQIQELQSTLAEATSQRQQEAAENAQTISDGKAGQAGVSSAIQVLREFYGSAAGATALTQKSVDAVEQEKMPGTFDTPYTGNQAGNTGVMGMLEVCESDFVRLVSDTEADEAEGDRVYRKFKDESETTIAVKQADVEDRTTQRTRAETKLNEDKKSLSGTSTELDAATDVYAKLKPECVDTGLSYEERVAKRAEEINSLKEAVKILSEE